MKKLTWLFAASLLSWATVSFASPFFYFFIALEAKDHSINF